MVTYMENTQMIACKYDDEKFDYNSQSVQIIILL